MVIGRPSWWGQAFEQVAALAPIKIVVVRWDGGDDAVVEWASPGTAELVGMEPRDVAWRCVSEVYPERYLPQIIEQFRQTREHGRLAYEVVRELPTGRRTLDAVSVALGDDLFVSIALDVTTEREAQRRLEEVTRLTGTGLYHWNVTTGEVTWTDEMFRLLGYEPGAVEPSAERYIGHIHPEDRGYVAEATARSEAVVNHRHRIVRPDGSIRTVDARGEPVTDDEGQLLYVLGVITDVTDEVELERHAALVRRAEQQQRTALTLHDSVVQALSTVVLALDLDEFDTARTEAMAAVEAAQLVVADLLAEVAAVQGTITPGSLRVRPTDDGTS